MSTSRVHPEEILLERQLHNLGHYPPNPRGNSNPSQLLSSQSHVGMTSADHKMPIDLGIANYPFETSENHQKPMTFPSNSAALKDAFINNQNDSQVNFLQALWPSLAALSGKFPLLSSQSIPYTNPAPAHVQTANLNNFCVPTTGPGPLSDFRNFSAASLGSYFLPSPNVPLMNSFGPLNVNSSTTGGASFPSLWLDFQRKSQIMLEEIRRKESSTAASNNPNLLAINANNASAAAALAATFALSSATGFNPISGMHLHPNMSDFQGNCGFSPSLLSQDAASSLFPQLNVKTSPASPPLSSTFSSPGSGDSSMYHRGHKRSFVNSSADTTPNGKVHLHKRHTSPLTNTNVSNFRYSKTSRTSSVCGNGVCTDSPAIDSCSKQPFSGCKPTAELAITRFKCTTCKRSYSTSTGLQKHREQHCQGGESGREYSCQHCDKVYHSMSALKMHIRTHTLPCKCTLCGKAFSRMWLLNGHIRTHTGEKPFSCHICARAFADRSNLRAHMQTHSEVKRYRCVRCDKTFSRMGLLTKHKGTGCGVSNSIIQNTSGLSEHQDQDSLMNSDSQDCFHDEQMTEKSLNSHGKLSLVA